MFTLLVVAIGCVNPGILATRVVHSEFFLNGKGHVVVVRDYYHKGEAANSTSRDNHSNESLHTGVALDGSFQEPPWQIRNSSHQLIAHQPEFNTSFMDHVTKYMGVAVNRNCVDNTNEANAGCNLGCHCGWSKNCYPRFVYLDGEVFRDHAVSGARRNLSAHETFTAVRLNVGMCQSSMGVLVFVSIALFSFFLTCIVAARTYLRLREGEDLPLDIGVVKATMIPVHLRAPSRLSIQHKALQRDGEKSPSGSPPRDFEDVAGQGKAETPENLLAQSPPKTSDATEVATPAAT